jgi:chemotaxis response regulator CheB
VISPARNRDSETGFIPARIPATSGVPKLEDRVSSNSVATHRARVFREKAGTFDLSFGSPPAWQSALREHRERQPRRPHSKAIAIHESTDGPAILRRVLSEPIEPDKDDLRDKVA